MTSETAGKPMAIIIIFFILADKDTRAIIKTLDRIIVQYNNQHT